MFFRININFLPLRHAQQRPKILFLQSLSISFIAISTSRKWQTFYSTGLNQKVQAERTRVEETKEEEDPLCTKNRRNRFCWEGNAYIAIIFSFSFRTIPKASTFTLKKLNYKRDSPIGSYHKKDVSGPQELKPMGHGSKDNKGSRCLRTWTPNNNIVTQTKNQENKIILYK